MKAGARCSYKGGTRGLDPGMTRAPTGATAGAARRGVTIAQMSGATASTVMPNENAPLRTINKAISGSFPNGGSAADLRAPATLAVAGTHQELKKIR